MRFILFCVFILSANCLLASDHVDPSEYLDPEDGGGSTSFFPILAVGGLIYAVYRMFAFFNEAKGKITQFDKIIVFICGLCIIFYKDGIG